MVAAAAGVDGADASSILRRALRPARSRACVYACDACVCASLCFSSSCVSGDGDDAPGMGLAVVRAAAGVDLAVDVELANLLVEGRWWDSERTWMNRTPRGRRLSLEKEIERHKPGEESMR